MENRNILQILMKLENHEGVLWKKPQSKSPRKAETGMPDLLTPQHNDVICKSMLQTHVTEMPKKQTEKRNYSIISRCINKVTFIAILKPQFGWHVWSKRNE